MIIKERLFRVLRAPHTSEKASSLIERKSTIVLKVTKNATKREIKSAMFKLFEVEIKDVNTLIVKGKLKKHGRYIGRRNDWKKAYITLKKGQSLDFIKSSE